MPSTMRTPEAAIGAVRCRKFVLSLGLRSVFWFQGLGFRLRGLRFIDSGVQAFDWGVVKCLLTRPPQFWWDYG